MAGAPAPPPTGARRRSGANALKRAADVASKAELHGANQEGEMARRRAQIGHQQVLCDNASDCADAQISLYRLRADRSSHLTDG
eukprot:gene22873-64878_t